MKIIKKCIQCNKEFVIQKSIIGKSGHVAKYCSHQCYWDSMKNKIKKYKMSIETRKKLSIANTGKKHSLKVIEILRQRMLGKTKEKSIHWKGGRILDSRGYYIIRLPEHPNSVNKYVPEHRLNVEKNIGRYLNHNEIVHHINGIKTDNRIENLVICQSLSEHRKYHKKIKV